MAAVGVAIRAVRRQPGGVYLDLPAKLLGQTLDAAAGKRSLVKVIDPAPRQLPAPSWWRAHLRVLKDAKRPLIILGKGAAYAQADADIRALIEKSGIPYLPMSMAKGLLPDNHPQSAGAARSMVLKDADVVMLIGARLNWLLSHGKGSTWGPAPKRFVQIDIEPKEMDLNVEIAAPVVGDIASCVAALLEGMGDRLDPRRPRIGPARSRRRSTATSPRWRPGSRTTTCRWTSTGALGDRIIKERPDAILVNEGANTLDFARSIIDMYQPRKRLDVGTWGIMEFGMGAAVAAAIETGKPVLAVEGDSAFGFSGMEVETICRYNLPVCVVVFNNNGNPPRHRRQPNRRAGRRDDGVRQGLALRQDDGSLRRPRRACDDARRARPRRERGDGLRQADPHQRGDRREGRHRERPHRQSQPARAGLERSRSALRLPRNSSEGARDEGSRRHQSP